MAGVSRLKAGTAEKLSEAVASNVADIDMWAAHTHQVVALLLQIQRAGEEKEKAWAHERAATAAATLAAARGAKLENALHAGIVAAEGRGVNATFRSWVVAVRSMREAEAQARRERSEERAERLASAGRGEMLEEHSRLLKDAAQAGRTVQEMKAKRLPFMSPERVARELSEGVETGAIAFTAKGDVDVVGKMYQRGFVSAIDDYTYNSDTERVKTGLLFYERLGWADAEGEVIVEALAYARKHCSPSYGKRYFRLFEGNSFGDATKAAMEAACKGEGEADIRVE